ncbi:hypothetical protein [Azospirillum sp. SYSU D00513]|nr:hypothetical protein [Azospirillum sp. SYSU D00513]
MAEERKEDADATRQESAERAKEENNRAAQGGKQEREPNAGHPV